MGGWGAQGQQGLGGNGGTGCGCSGPPGASSSLAGAVTPRCRLPASEAPHPRPRATPRPKGLVPQPLRPQPSALPCGLGIGECRSAEMISIVRNESGLWRGAVEEGAWKRVCVMLRVGERGFVHCCVQLLTCGGKQTQRARGSSCCPPGVGAGRGVATPDPAPSSGKCVSGP